LYHGRPARGSHDRLGRVFTVEILGRDARETHGRDAHGTAEASKLHLMSKLSHLDSRGNPAMVDVSGKATTARRAVAEGFVILNRAHLAALNDLPKGDPVSVAEVAGIMAAKRTSELIPLCHPIPLSSVAVEITLEEDRFRITATTKTEAQTGVEMEAYTAVAIAGVTLVDMLKGIDPDLKITDIRLLEKTGGKADWKRR